MIGKSRFMGRDYEITKAELHIPEVDDTHYLFLSFEGTPNTIMTFEGAELPMFEGLDNLDGKRIHIYADGEGYDDDDLGTDVVGSDWFEEVSSWMFADEYHLFGDVRIDFSRIEGNRFRIHMECQLAGSDVDDVSDLSPGEFEAVTAEFEVDIDHEDVLGWGE